MAKRGLAAELLDIGRGIGRVTLYFYVPVVTLLVLIHFPYDVDPSLYGPAKVEAASVAGSAPTQKKRTSDFYESAYLQGPKPKGIDYESTARTAADNMGITSDVKAFVREHHLEDKKVLEVGSGRGSLQDVVADYTGLDLSPTVAPLYHKKFVVGSATAMPFPDHTFDAIWTVWVLEHIPEPERALREMRRVVKPGGKIYLRVAWGCQSWYADGFDVRSYEDFNWKGKLVKASLLVRDQAYIQTAYMLPTRIIRLAHYGLSGKKTPLRFHALEANYDVYWRPDSDASTGLDTYEAYLWHRAQGDECLNCEGPWGQMTAKGEVLVIGVRKRGEATIR